MGLNPVRFGESQPKRLDFGLRNRGRFAVEGYDLHHARNGDYLQSGCQRNLHEQVSRKKRQIYFFPAVLPAPDAPIQGQIAVDLAVSKEIGNALLVPTAGVNGVPERRVTSLRNRGV